MNSTLRILISLMIAALLPATVMAQKTSYDYDRSQQFTQLRTYSFRDSTETNNPFVDKRIAEAVAVQLAARGMTRDDAHPDVYVTTLQKYDTHQEYEVYNSGYPYGWGWGYGYGFGGPWYSDVRVKDVVVRTLTIDFTDASTNQLVWRGVGVSRVHSASKPSHIDKRIYKEVKEIFEHYPPTVTLAVTTDGL
jgi:Domain of unknown function (DUF4136)